MENARVFEMYPLSAKLGVRFVRTNPDQESDHEGFDSEEVAEKLGPVRWDVLRSMFGKEIPALFCCGHRNYNAGTTIPGITRRDLDGNEQPVDLGGFEVHCIYAKDLEKFLQGGH